MITILWQRVWSNAYLLMVMTTLMWAGNAVASKLAVGNISPMTVSTLRWFVALVVLPVVLRRQLPVYWPVLRPRWGYILSMGLFGLTAFNSLMFIAGSSTTAVNMGILQGAIPIFVLIGAFLFHRTPIGWIQALGVGFTLAGIVVVASQGDWHMLTSLSFATGDLWMILAGMFYASFTVRLKDRPAVPGFVLFTAFCFAAALVALPLFMIEIAAGKAFMPTLTGWVILGYVVLGPTFLSQVFFMRSVELIGPGRAGLFVNLCPVFAPILAVALAGEHLQLYHGAALVLVLGGIFVAERFGRRKEAEA